MELTLAYDRPTTLTSRPDGTALDFAVNTRRQPVAFRGLVRDPLLLRQLLLVQHACILSDERGKRGTWLDQEEWQKTVDPIITVHRDQLSFEAFSTDGSAYARLSAPLAAFDVQGEMRTGTTNIDFSWDLRDALQNLRTSRRTEFQIGAEGVGVATEGLASQDHFERKIDVPTNWLKGFLQVQSALTMKPFLFDMRPVDMLTVLAFLDENVPKKPPHGVRYVLKPDAPIEVVLEPWNKSFPLRGTHYTGYDRTVRVWGRRRLQMLREVLPFADKVTVGVLGRGLPHIYICQCGPYQFLLALSGWTTNDWSDGSAFDLLAPRQTSDPEVVTRVYSYLGEQLAARPDEIASVTGFAPNVVEQALFHLCRGGRVMYDVVTRRYRLRELFSEPLDLDTLFVPSPRLEKAQQLIDEGRVELPEKAVKQQRRNRRQETVAELTVSDDATYKVSVSIDSGGRLRYGRCECAFFQMNLMSRGPCEHILAGRMAVETVLQKRQPDLVVASASNVDVDDIPF